MTVTVAALAGDVLDVLSAIDANFPIYVTAAIVFTFGGWAWRRFTRAR